MDNIKNICSYGCGVEAITQFKNGKFCCSLSKNQCKEVINFNKLKNIGRKQPPGTGEKISNKLKGRIPWNRNISGYHLFINEETKKRMRESKQGKPGPMKGKIHSQGAKLKISKSNTGKKRSMEAKRKYSKVSMGRLFSNETRNKMKISALKRCTKEWREKEREKMLNGKAVYINSFIKNPSTPQVTLFKITLEIYPKTILNYPTYRGKGKKNYSIDIAIPDLGIAIEYDGSYWHKDKEKDLERQKHLEEDGWIVLRYWDKIPLKKELLKDILDNSWIF